MRRAGSASGAEAPQGVQVADDGQWLVPVQRGIAFRDEGEAQAYLVADNRHVELGGWDDSMLADVLLEEGY